MRLLVSWPDLSGLANDRINAVMTSVEVPVRHSCES